MLEENKLKEIKNGRLAMLAFLGFVAQHAATGKVCLSPPATVHYAQPTMESALPAKQSDCHIRIARDILEFASLKGGKGLALMDHVIHVKGILSVQWTVKTQK